MKTITIPNIQDAKEGDTITYAYDGHEATGKAWSRANALFVGTATVRYANGHSSPDAISILSITREVPETPLPTAKYSLIRWVGESGGYGYAERSGDKWWGKWDEYGYASEMTNERLTEFLEGKEWVEMVPKEGANNG